MNKECVPVLLSVLSSLNVLLEYLSVLLEYVDSCAKDLVLDVMIVFG